MQYIFWFNLYALTIGEGGGGGGGDPIRQATLH